MAGISNINNIHAFELLEIITYSNLDEETREKIKKGHLNRINQGSHAWNGWAEKLKEHMQEEAVEYIIDFSETEFDRYVSFIALVFPCTVSFESSEFSGYAEFRNAQFRREVRFSKAKFNGNAFFSKAKFNDYADFSDAKFNGYADFSDAKFDGYAYYLAAQFKDYANFNKAKFNGNAYFIRTQYDGVVDYDFSKFKYEADFSAAVFNSVCSFKGASFRIVPDYNFANFVQPPHIDDMVVKDPKYKSDSGLVKRYRKIKEMAIQSKDFENELKYFGLEMQSKAYIPTTRFSKKFFILAYQALSDFGKSLGRPILALLFFLSAMTITNGLYIYLANDISKECNEHKTKYVGAVIQYTLSEASPLFKLDPKRAQQIERCLFYPKALDIRNSLWRIAHFLPTTLFLFLFGLAVRNKFKIR